MEKQRNIKVLSVVALIVAVLGLTVAFAALTATLNISSTARVTGGTWDIKFSGLSEKKLVGTAQELVAPSLDVNATNITGISVSLSKPGDSVTYTFDVVNAGSIDAKISSLSKTKGNCPADNINPLTTDMDKVCANLVFSLTYDDNDSDGVDVAEDDILERKGETPTTKKMRLTIGYSGDAAAIPSDNVELENLGIAITYSQN